MKQGAFVSETLPTLELMEIELPDSLTFKFVYAPEGEGMEIEWKNKNKE